MKAWEKFQQDVSAARKSLGFGPQEECFYRGHREATWALLPSLLRHLEEAGITHADDIRNFEATLFFEFRARAREIQNLPLSDWDVLFFMRHHGVATRLLDWTEVLGVAVYFALRNATRDSSPCIWVLNPYRLNKISCKVSDLVAPEYLPTERRSTKHCSSEPASTKRGYSQYLVDFSKSAGFGWKKPVALYPVQRNSRLHAQHGYFTIHGENSLPLDEICPSVVRKVPLPIAAVEEARAFFEFSGISELLLFPDLDGLARHLQARYLRDFNNTK